MRSASRQPALAAVSTGQPVYRENILQGAVFTRVAASHIRVGTFQFFTARGDTDGVRALADYVIDRHYPELKDRDNPYLALYEAVCERQAALIARWLHIGFIHGVMNTDNMTISGETIDFGPCAFMDEYHPGTVFSSIDQGGRYAYANQPGIGQWNLARLGETLLPLFDADAEKAVELANSVIQQYGERFQIHWLRGMREKIGLSTVEDGDLDLIQSLLAAMQAQPGRPYPRLPPPFRRRRSRRWRGTVPLGFPGTGWGARMACPLARPPDP